MIDNVSGLGSVYSSMDWQTIQPDRGKMFEKIDASGDGSLDKAEFGTFTDRLSEMTGTTVDSEEAFATADVNNDGVLDSDEFFTAGEKMREEMGRTGKPMMGKRPNSMTSLFEMMGNSDSSTEEDTTGTLLNSGTDDWTDILMQSYTNYSDLLMESSGSLNFLT